MTRMFGVESTYKPLDTELHKPEVEEVFSNMQESLQTIYLKGWHSFGAGLIVATNDGAFPFSLYKGHRGLTPDHNILEEFQKEAAFTMPKSLNALFGVIECQIDEGEESFNSLNYANLADMMPFQSKNWLVMTMGKYYHGNFSDQELPWYNQEKPWLSIPQYLDTDPPEINFKWLDKSRIPFVVCVHKSGKQIIFEDYYSANNQQDRFYSIANRSITSGSVQIFGGIRDRTYGKIV